MVAPTAKDADGARFNIVVKDSPGAVINVSVDSERDRILTSSSKSDAMEEVIGSPTVERFNNVVLAFTQLRKDDSGIGDRGVISSISKKSKKIVSDDKSFKEIEKEHFKENELWICKGRRLQMTNIVNHMKICRKSIDKDVDRGVPTESVLDTTMGAMDSLVEVCEEELRTNPNLIAGEIDPEKVDGE